MVVQPEAIAGTEAVQLEAIAGTVEALVALVALVALAAPADPTALAASTPAVVTVVEVVMTGALHGFELSELRRDMAIAASDISAVALNVTFLFCDAETALGCPGSGSSESWTPCKTADCGSQVMSFGLSSAVIMGTAALDWCAERQRRNRVLFVHFRQPPRSLIPIKLEKS